MILPAEAPLEPFGWPLHALFVALNTPVVTLDSLPTGPASAAVARHAEGASLCVRAVRSGGVRWFVTTDDLRGDPRVAVDAALSFAESMGFLFDDDEVARRGDRGPEEAVAIWRSACGEEAPDDESVSILDLEEPAPLQSTEILLTDAEESPRADLAPAQVLTKFRRIPGTAEADEASESAPADLRVRLMSRF